MNTMTQAEYARHRGVSRQAVNKLIKSGKLPLTSDGRIDLDQADAQIAQLDPSRSKAANFLTPSPGFATEGGSEAPSPAGASRGAQSAYAKHREEREYWSRLREQLDYEKAAGLLIDRAGVERALHEAARMLRDSLLSSRRRLSAEISMLTDAAEIERKLVEEDRRLLADFVRIAGSGVARVAAPN